MNVINVTGYKIYNSSIVKGDGCYLYDNNGDRYIDFESGVWALPLGHNCKRVNDAIIKQLSEISHIGFRFSHKVVEEAAGILLDIMKLNQGKCVFLSSGSEAVEFAVKIIKKVTGRPYLLKLKNHYLSAYGDSGHLISDKWISIDCQGYTDCSDYEDLLKDIPFEKIGAFVFEPGNASGNVRLPDKELVHAIVSKIKEHKGWIVVDEVTTGIGRTGKWFGYQHYDIQPDIIACGKGLGNGYPVSAVGISGEFCDSLEKTDFTYAQSHQNDPLGCAVAKEVLTVIKEEGYIDKAIKKGVYLTNKLSELQMKHSCIKEVRGVGLMCSIEFQNSVDSVLLEKLHRQLFDEGFYTGLKLQTKVLRFYPPLIIEEQMIDELIKVLDNILSNLRAD